MTWEETLALCDTFLASGTPHQIVTPNPEFVMKARRDAGFRELIAAADLAPADGVGLLWAGRRLGQPLREVVPGSELMVRLAERWAARGARWFFLGAEEGVAEAVGRRLASTYPGLVVAGSYSGTPHAHEDDLICRRIEAAGPVDVLAVAYGAPAQERWIARNQSRLRIPIAIGVGGTFNFVAGRSRRPPEWVRRWGLIWLFRLATEPWRWKRQLVLARFVWAVLTESNRRR